MMMRSIAAALCLLYLGASTLFASVHHHDGSFDDQHCTACSWHHDGTVDLPAVAPLPVRPEIIVFLEESSDIPLRELSPRIHPSRGPPSVLL